MHVGGALWMGQVLAQPKQVPVLGLLLEVAPRFSPYTEELSSTTPLADASILSSHTDQRMSSN